MAREFLQEMGKKIRAARKDLKMSQQDLADLANCSPQLISKIEKGQVDTTISTLLSIQKSIGIMEGLTGDIFFENLEAWAKESGGSENIDWFKNQIECAFPMFKEWKKRKEETKNSESENLSSKVA